MQGRRHLKEKEVEKKKKKKHFETICCLFAECSFGAITGTVYAILEWSLVFFLKIEWSTKFGFKRTDRSGLH